MPRCFLRNTAAASVFRETGVYVCLKPSPLPPLSSARSPAILLLYKPTHHASRKGPPSASREGELSSLSDIRKCQARDNDTPRENSRFLSLQTRSRIGLALIIEIDLCNRATRSNSAYFVTFRKRDRYGRIKYAA